MKYKFLLIFIIVLILSGLMIALKNIAIKERILSTVYSVDYWQQNVVIQAGLDKGVRAGDRFTLSREGIVTAHVDVLEVADVNCKAAGYISAYGPKTRTRVDDVRPGDKAQRVEWTVGDALGFLFLGALLIACGLGTLLGLWRGFWKGWNNVKKNRFCRSDFLCTALWFIGTGFWTLFLWSAFAIAVTTYQALFVDGLYLQNLMLLYPLVGILAGALYGLARFLVALARA